MLKLIRQPAVGTATTVELPNMRWSNEFEWSPIAQATPQRALSGYLITQYSERFGGRPIELRGWTSRADLKSIYAMQDFLLTDGDNLLFETGDGTQYYVRFAADVAAIQAEPLVDYTDPADADLYSSVTLRLFEN